MTWRRASLGRCVLGLCEVADDDAVDNCTIAGSVMLSGEFEARG